MIFGKYDIGFASQIIVKGQAIIDDFEAYPSKSRDKRTNILPLKRKNLREGLILVEMDSQEFPLTVNSDIVKKSLSFDLVHILLKIIAKRMNQRWVFFPFP